MKVVVHRGYNGVYLLSKKAQQFLGVTSGFAYEDDRANKKLVECVETLGGEAGDGLEVVEIPDDIEWTIIDFVGYETIVEEGHYW